MSLEPKTMTIDKLYIDDLLANLSAIAEGVTDVLAWIDEDPATEQSYGLTAAARKIAVASHCSLKTIAHAVERDKAATDRSQE